MTAQEETAKYSALADALDAWAKRIAIGLVLRDHYLLERSASALRESIRQLSECQALLRRIRSSINTNGELSVLCMQDIDAALAEKVEKGG